MMGGDYQGRSGFGEPGNEGGRKATKRRLEHTSTPRSKQAPQAGDATSRRLALVLVLLIVIVIHVSSLASRLDERITITITSRSGNIARTPGSAAMVRLAKREQVLPLHGSGASQVVVGRFDCAQGAA